MTTMQCNNRISSNNSRTTTKVLTLIAFCNSYRLQVCLLFLRLIAKQAGAQCHCLILAHRKKCGQKDMKVPAAVACPFEYVMK